jgi:DNA-nicking Smr family endonuclease
MPSREPWFSSHDSLLDGKASASLDLHGFGAAEARTAVVAFIRRNRSGSIVHIVTGKGKGSAGKPVLRSVVSGMLKGELAPLVADWALDSDDGGFKVLVGRLSHGQSQA